MSYDPLSLLDSMTMAAWRRNMLEFTLKIKVSRFGFNLF